MGVCQICASVVNKAHCRASRPTRDRRRWLRYGDKNYSRGDRRVASGGMNELTRHNLSNRPILHVQTRHTRELTDVIGNQGGAEAQGMGSNQRIQWSDGFSLLLQGGAQ